MLIIPIFSVMSVMVQNNIITQAIRPNVLLIPFVVVHNVIPTK